MTMAKMIVVFALLAVAVGGFAYGAYHHSRFIKLGGQRGCSLVAPEAQTDAMREPYRGMKLGYAMAFASIALAGLVTAVWGPVVI
jgi:hypothetical protein